MNEQKKRGRDRRAVVELIHDHLQSSPSMTMDPPAMATPSFKLAMVPSAATAPASCPPDLVYDQLCTMVGQEARDGYTASDYLRCYYSPHSLQPEKERSAKKIDEGCRTSICGWMYRVADHFSIDREVVAIALSYIDRTLSTNFCADRRTFKLISATALHLAIKTHFPTLWRDVGSLLPDLSRGDFHLEDMVDMEKEMVQALAWLMNPATAQSIAMHILTLLPSNAPRSTLNDIASKALFLTELSVCDYYFVTSRKSVVAIAAVLNAYESSGFFEYTHIDFGGRYHRNNWHLHVEKLFSDIGYLIDWNEISSARERLWSLYRQSSESTLEQDAGPPIPPRKSRKSNNSSPRYLHDYPSPTSCIDQGMY